MNVCLVSGEYPPQVGGVGDFTDLLARALREQGHRVSVITGRRPGGRCDPPTGLVDLMEVAGWGWRSLPEVRRLVVATGADVVHLQYQTGAFGMHPAVCFLPGWLERAAVPTAVTFHDLREPYLFPKAGGLRGFVTRHMVRSCGMAIATNPADAAAIDAVRRAGRPDGLPAQTPVVPIGNNIPVLTPPERDPTATRRELGIDPGTLVVGFFGMVNDSKGTEVLVELMERVRGAAATPVQLWFIGDPEGASDPSNRSTLRHLQSAIDAHGLRGIIKFTGYLDREGVSRALSALDCCVLPYADGASYRRGSLLVALAHGVPVVTTTPAPAAMGAGLPRLEDGENCLLVPLGDAAGAARGILRIAADPALRDRLSRGAVEFAAAFSLERIAAATADCYRRLVGDRRPVPAPAGG